MGIMMAGVIFISTSHGFPWNGPGFRPRPEIRLYWGVLSEKSPTTVPCARSVISRLKPEVRANQPPSQDWTGTGLGLELGLGLGLGLGWDWDWG